MKTILDTSRQDNWLKNKAGTTPASTQIHPLFMAILKEKKLKILDSGCGNGRISVELAKMGHRVAGIDINEAEIDYAKSLHHGISFSVGNAESLKFQDEQFDCVITLGLFGGVDKKTREKIFAECYRVVKPGGYIYLGEFARILNPAIKTSNGKRWVDVYKNDMSLTGEYGSVIVHPNDVKKSFIAHHFSESDLISLAIDYHLQAQEMKKVFTVSIVSGEKRPSWNAWFQKTSV